MRLVFFFSSAYWVGVLARLSFFDFWIVTHEMGGGSISSLEVEHGRLLSPELRLLFFHVPSHGGGTLLGRKIDVSFFVSEVASLPLFFHGGCFSGFFWERWVTSGGLLAPRLSPLMGQPVFLNNGGSSNGFFPPPYKGVYDSPPANDIPWGGPLFLRVFFFPE